MHDQSLLNQFHLNALSLAKQEYQPYMVLDILHTLQEVDVKRLNFNQALRLLDFQKVYTIINMTIDIHY